MLTKLNLVKTLNQGESHQDVERLASYLETAGYLQRGVRDGNQMLGPNIGAAVRRYQAYRGLPVTGTLDEATLRDLNSVVRYDPQPDVPPGAPLGELGVSEGFVTAGTKWGTQRLRYSFTNVSPDVTAERQRAACRCALKLWSQVVPLYFVEVPDSASPHIRIGFYTGNHGDGSSFDAAGGVLAHAFYPPPNGGDIAGDTHFDEAETWTINFRNSGAQPIDLVTVALHEFGHALGLMHSGDSAAVMYAYYGGSRRALTLDDINGMRAQYGIGNPAAPMPQGFTHSLIRGNDRHTSAGGVRANVFFRGGNGQLRQAYWNGASWTTIVQGITIQGDPMMMVRGNRESVNGSAIRINLFAVGANSHLYERYWNGSSWITVDHGGSLVPGICMFGRGDFGSVNAGGIRINLFACGTNGHLMERYWNGNQWVWADHGGAIGGGIAATGRGNFRSTLSGGVRINLFMRGSNGHLMERYWNGGQWVWSDHGGAVNGSPIMIGRGHFDAIDGGGIRINLFVRGSNGHLMERYWNGGAWVWGDRGGNITHAPLCWTGHGNFYTVDGDQIRLRIFAQGANNHLIEYHWNTAAWEMVDHGGSITGDLVNPLLRGDRVNPDAAAVRINMFAVGTNGNLQERYWNGSQWVWGAEHIEAELKKAA
jgi:predicted Zn-dependent protease